jgi:hypothetical protein
VRLVQTRRRSVRAPLALAFLIGGVLLMHGLEASVAGGHGTHGGEVAALGAGDAHHAPADDAAHCPDCWSHALAACLAVLAGLFTLQVARRRLRVGIAVVLPQALARARERWELWRPPEPAWVRLAVMRC